MIRPAQVLSWILAGILACGVGFFLLNDYHQRRYDAAQTTASILKGERDAAMEAAGAAEKRQAEASREVTIAAEAAGAADQNVAKLKARLAAVQKTLASLPAVPGNPVVPGTADSLGVPDVPGHDPEKAAMADLIAGQDQEIQALKLEIGAQEHLVFEMQGVINSQKKALDLGFQRERALEIALDAQKHVAKAGKWMGRFQGFLIGVGAGYATKSGRM